MFKYDYLQGHVHVPIDATEILFCVPQGVAMLRCSLLMKSGKRLFYDVTDTCTIHSGLVNDITDTDCRT